MIYRFTRPILLPDGAILPEGDAIIVDNPDSKDAVNECVKKAIKEGLLADPVEDLNPINKLLKEKAKKDAEE